MRTADRISRWAQDALPLAFKGETVTTEEVRCAQARAPPIGYIC